MDGDVAGELVLDAAEELFYQRGVHAVGMDAVRTRSGVSLKLLYQLFSSKEYLVEAYLRRRDVRWRGRLARHVEAEPDPALRLLAVFDWLGEWFSEPDFHGCAFINSFGEVGATSPGVAAVVREHKDAFGEYLRELAAAAGYPAWLADQLTLLAEGAMVTAGISGSPDSALKAKEAAAMLLAHAV
ncbi:MAG: TetR family transcriptional regulator [Amycolatopsis sp.]|jgi:AcrR family transcriptional regulator|uniref:TetR/AcrR family transcriptional regulator n=1 Tax=Amycolatopsis sp. TaxID=37632 RepID=UPI00261DE5E6|nr:TetR/AcrR family transcriptional regulator [Amycolatopsis sp.]MCU1679277.1 TetR family transcriptional regulator [Amycolatopsis sp.]